MKYNDVHIAGLIPRSALVAVTAALLAFAPRDALALVDPGWDLFDTINSTNFLGVSLQGVPIGNFNFSTYPGDGTGDFGRGIGVVNVGQTDTIIKRLDVGLAGIDSSIIHMLPNPSLLSLAAGGLGPFNPANDTARIGLEVVGLQLQTTAPTTFGGLLPSSIYSLTLQSDRGVLDPVPDHVGNSNDLSKNNNPFSMNTNLSLGIMDIHNANSPTGGTFDSAIDIKFDLRSGGLTGDIMYSGDLILRNFGGIWGRDPLPKGVIKEIHTGSGSEHDALPDDIFIPGPTPGGGGEFHVTSAVPESSTYGIFAAFLCASSVFVRRFRNRRN